MTIKQGLNLLKVLRFEFAQRLMTRAHDWIASKTQSTTGGAQIGVKTRESYERNRSAAFSKRSFAPRLSEVNWCKPMGILNPVAFKVCARALPRISV